MNSDEQLKKQVDAAPNKPGVYQYYDSKDRLLYIGKAKVLKNRVRSYFTKDKGKNGKTRLLVSKIAFIKYIITETEMDALLLENSLIKQHQPRYNVLLKDDKTFPWICIKKERFPRVFSTRTLVQDGSEYYGPYTSAKMMHIVLDLVRKNYKLRTCNFNLSKENIQAGKFKTCLEYHIGNCLGPCENLQDETSYMQHIEEIRNIVKGNVVQVRLALKQQMKKAVEELDFETAEQLKQKTEALEKFQIRSTVVNPKIHNVDVFSIEMDQDLAYVNYMKVSNGAIIQGNTLEMRRKLEESKEELLALAIVELRKRFNSQSKKALVPFLPDYGLDHLNFTVPVRGDKKKLLELSERNAKYYRMERRKQHQKTDPERHTKRILNTLKEDLRLKELPVHIECFDNSNIQGTNPVAACVVFKNAKPAKKEYRHFNIKTVVGPDDFASMEEVVYRRYKRLQQEGENLPQLIVIDGGKGQLSSSLKSLDRLGLRGKIAIVGIAKRLEEIFYPGDQYPLYLDKSSESLKVLQHLRNEAHRFGITHHRNRRSKNSIQSELEGINGIGPQSQEALLRHFKSVKRIKEASLKELSTVIQSHKAKLVFHFFKGSK